MSNIINHRILLALLILSLSVVPLVSFSADIKGPVIFAGPDQTVLPSGVKTATITGRFTVKGGGTMTGGKVSLYNALNGPPPSPRNYMRLPDMTGDIGPDGSFKIDVPAGEYYILAFKRSAEGLGLPAKEDYRFRVRDDKGEIKKHSIKEGDSVDLGLLVVDPSRKIERKPADPDISHIEGIITDLDGKPVENELVYAFLSPKKGAKPVFASIRSDKTGRYVLRVVEGSYYLRVKSELGGGAPTVGQLVDSFGEKDPLPVTVKKGEKMTGVDMKVEKYPGTGPFPLTGPKYGKGPKQDKVEKPGFSGQPRLGIEPLQKGGPKKDAISPKPAAPEEDSAPRLKPISQGTGPKSN